MARRNDTTRMGMLGLLLLVVSICLAVLGALSLVTSHSDAVMAQRHSDSVENAQLADGAAQRFIGEMDGWLARYAAQSRSSSQSVSSDRIAASLEPDLQSMVGSAVDEELASAEDASGKNLFGDAVMLRADELLLGREAGVEAARRYLCGVRAVFAVDQTKMLTLVIGIGDDLSYELLDCTLTTEWADGPSDLNLWKG